MTLKSRRDVQQTILRASLIRQRCCVRLWLDISARFKYRRLLCEQLADSLVYYPLYITSRAYAGIHRGNMYSLILHSSIRKTKRKLPADNKPRDVAVLHGVSHSADYFSFISHFVRKKIWYVECICHKFIWNASRELWEGRIRTKEVNFSEISSIITVIHHTQMQIKNKELFSGSSLHIEEITDNGKTERNERK